MGSSPPAPASPAPVLLHIGAHKTASTHLQSVLLANRDRLRAAGCAYFGPDLLRGDLKLPRARAVASVYQRDLSPLRGAVDAARAEGCRVLLSDENIHGGGPRPPLLAAGGVYYPQAEARVARLLEGLGVRDAVLCLALREPVAHLVSGWGHQYLAGRPMSFAEYCADVDIAALRWSELVGRLAGLRDVAQVLVWRQEEYGALAGRLFPALTGVEAAALDWPEALAGRASLVGPSARAMEEVPGIMARNPGLEPKQAVRRAMRRFPKSAQWPAPEAVAADLRAASCAQYAADWARLCAMPGVTCLTP
ncbi:MAG: hypothetical protein JJU24_17455 [Natronohydrobacter sp.]|nr:hypothetical protein [Natronohydrobacter sp.]